MWRTAVINLVTAVWLLAGVPATGLARPFQDPAPAADAGQFFDDRTVADIHLTMTARDWATLKEHYLESTDYPVTFEWNGITVGNSTVRSRGSGTRNPQKPGLRVDFDRINKSQRFLGLKYFVLDNLWQDPSMIKERVTMLFFGRMGIPVPREAHVRLYINGEYAGLYAAVEALDDLFVDRALGSTDGYLYEYNWEQAYHFEYLGPDLAAYKNFDPKTHSKDPDELIWRPLEQMIKTMNDAPDGTFERDVSPYLDLAAFTRQIALENFIAESDGLLGDWGLDNFYLYRPVDSTRFQVLEWDKDNTFHDARQPILKGVADNLLSRRTFSDPAFMDLYFQTLLDGADAAEAGATAGASAGSLGGSTKSDGPGRRRSADRGGWMEREILREYRQIREFALADPVKPVTNDEFDAAIQSLLQFAADRPAFVRAEVARVRAAE